VYEKMGRVGCALNPCPCVLFIVRAPRPSFAHHVHNPVQRFRILQHGLAGSPDYIKLATLACLLLHNFCVAHRQTFSTRDLDECDDLEDVLTLQEASAGGVAHVADELMTTGLDATAPPADAEEQRLQGIMLSPSVRQDIIGEAGWEIYQRVTTNRAQRQALLSMAVEYQEAEAARETTLGTKARRRLERMGRS